MTEKPKIGELFSGYGGLGLAVEEVFGAELAWYAEFDKAPSKIMAHHWPNLTNYGDVTTVDWSTVPPVDIISGGSPCQDLSLAGARKGMNDGTRSNLWESMREAIATIKPTYVVWENVRGSLSATATSASDMGPREGFLGERGGHLRALGRVLGDLADLGYDTQWCGLRASDVGAPHGRFRIFLLATRRDTISDTSCDEPERRGILRNVGSAETQNEGTSEERERIRHTTSNSRPTPTGWGGYGPAIRRWEAVRGTAPAPAELTTKGKHRLSARFAEWMMGVDAGWITDTPGISRNDQLKAAGNGVVPQQAAAALRHMLNHERTTR